MKTDQIININKNWRIVRRDPLNWQIQEFVEINKRDGTTAWEWDDEHNYYGSAIAAINALPTKMLDGDANTSLAHVRDSMESIKRIIKEAIGVSHP